jgi:hypothetical protein
MTCLWTVHRSSLVRTNINHLKNNTNAQFGPPYSVDKKTNKNYLECQTDEIPYLI